jgi:4-hydroxy-2-oxoglutarate aldolase
LPEKAPDWLTGILVPVTTPFDEATGEVAPVDFRQNLRHWLAAGVDGIVLFGSTGEGVLLDEDEKLRMVDFARDLCPPEVTLVAGAGAESTRATIRQARQLADAGAEAILVHPPAYYGAGLSQGALHDHFAAIADASPVPVILYHIPKYTKVVLEAGMVGELVRHPNVAGVKDSSGELKRLADYSTACAGACRLLVGSGALLFAGLELGAGGGIIAVGLLAPALAVELLRRHRSDDSPGAGRLQERLGTLHKEIVVRHGVPGIKAALDLLGLRGGPPRPPLRPATEAERRSVAQVLQRAGLL